MVRCRWHFFLSSKMDFCLSITGMKSNQEAKEGQLSLKGDSCHKILSMGKHLHRFMNVVSHQILLYRSLFFLGACRVFFSSTLRSHSHLSLSERCQDDRQGLGKVRIPDMLTQKNWLVGSERLVFGVSLKFP